MNCFSCLENFKETSEFFLHIRNNHKDIECYTCCICNQKFSRFAAFKKHFIKHSIPISLEIQSKSSDTPSAHCSSDIEKQNCKFLKCSQCICLFDSVDSLISHLLKDHHCKTISKFQCNQTKCRQKFHDVHRFKKHLKSHLLKQQNEFNTISYEVYEDSNILSNQISILSSSDESDVISENDILNETVSDIERTQTSISADITSIENAMVSFTLNLHAKSNITRKDVSSIQVAVTDCIIKPLLENIRDFQNNYFTDQDKMERAKFNEMFDKLQHPFKNIQTEYMFFKKITEIGIFEMPTPFLINESIAETIKNYNPVLDTRKIQAIMMPIQFQLRKYFEAQNVFQETLNNMELLDKQTSITNFVNAQWWKSRKSHYGGKCFLFIINVIGYI